MFKLEQLSKLATKEQRKLLVTLMHHQKPCHHTLVHLSYSARIHRSSDKDYNFGQVTVKKRMEVGYRDARAMISESNKWSHPDKEQPCVVYEAPNNLSRLMKLND